MSVLAMRSCTEMAPPALNQVLKDACQQCLHLEPNALPKVTSPVVVHQQNGNASPRKFRMIAKLYESSFGHYVLLNQDKLYSGSPVYFNLKNTSVQRVSDSERNLLRFVSDSCDGMSLTIGLSSEEVLQKWLDVVESVNSTASGPKSPAIPRSRLLPTLTEDDEE